MSKFRKLRSTLISSVSSSLESDVWSKSKHWSLLQHSLHYDSTRLRPSCSIFLNTCKSYAYGWDLKIFKHRVRLTRSPHYFELNYQDETLVVKLWHAILCEEYKIEKIFLFREFRKRGSATYELFKTLNEYFLLKVQISKNVVGWLVLFAPELSQSNMETKPFLWRFNVVSLHFLLYWSVITHRKMYPETNNKLRNQFLD